MNPNAKTTETQPVVRNESQRTEVAKARRERDSNTGGLTLKLRVFGEIPGYKLYWANDEDAAIEELLMDGFDFVSPSEVKMQSRVVQDKDLGDRVSKYVGTRADGSPLRAYLMKCPDEIWEEREARRYAQADEWDSAIIGGNIQNVDNRYVPQGHDIKLRTK